ncbi:MAG TPA: HU family DNA-binding protein [Candidatus Saccharibacteria bacterium]|nr:HU family DNA-binding protein [Candidatus Saccharibacteria bacterium]HMT39670.1 HU family DNA-binding protein [Candidatus Saccharibacteria bacterium]
MTHRELIEELADSANITKRQAEKLLGKLSMIVMSEVKHGQKVNITGFGTFYLGKRAARNGINPMTGEKIDIPKIMLPKFRAGSRFKKMVR